MKIDKAKKYRGVQAFTVAKQEGVELSKADKKGLMSRGDACMSGGYLTHTKNRGWVVMYAMSASQFAGR